MKYLVQVLAVSAGLLASATAHAQAAGWSTQISKVGALLNNPATPQR